MNAATGTAPASAGYALRARAVLAEVPGLDQELAAYYAVLLLVEGSTVTPADVHAAWAVWRSLSDPGHPYCHCAFAELEPDVQRMTVAVWQVLRDAARALDSAR